MDSLAYNRYKTSCHKIVRMDHDAPERGYAGRAGAAGCDSKSDTDPGENTAATDLHVSPAFPGRGGEILVLHEQADMFEPEFHAREALKSRTPRTPFQVTAVGGVGVAHADADERMEPVRHAEVVLSVCHQREHLLFGTDSGRDQIVLVVEDLAAHCEARLVAQLRLDAERRLCRS